MPDQWHTFIENILQKRGPQLKPYATHISANMTHTHTQKANAFQHFPVYFDGWDYIKYSVLHFHGDTLALTGRGIYFECVRVTCAIIPGKFYEEFIVHEKWTQQFMIIDSVCNCVKIKLPHTLSQSLVLATNKNRTCDMSFGIFFSGNHRRINRLLSFICFIW